MKQSIALAALVATTIGFAAAPVLAQDAAPVAVKAAMQNGHGLRNGGGMGPAGIFGLVCSDRGAEELDVALVRLSYRLQLTAEQQPLFDTFRSTALTSQTSFADSCQASMPDRSADAERPDLLNRLKSGLALDEARLEAMNAVLPDFEALYASLTDAQKAELLPRRGFMMQFDDRGGPDRPDRNGPDRDLRAPAPGR